MVSYDDMYKEVIGERIRSLRGEESIRSFAKELEIDYKTLINIENGSFYPSFKVLLKIKEKRNVDIAWIIGECDTARVRDQPTHSELGLDDGAIENLTVMAQGNGFKGIHDSDNDYLDKEFFNPEGTKEEIYDLACGLMDRIKRKCTPAEKIQLKEFVPEKDPRNALFRFEETMGDDELVLELKIINYLITDLNLIKELAAYCRSFSPSEAGMVNSKTTLFDSDIYLLDCVIKEVKNLRHTAVQEWDEISSYLTPEQYEEIRRMYHAYCPSMRIFENEEDDDE